MEEKFITIVDIGSYRTAVCTAKVEGSNVNIAAYKEALSDGVLRGAVLNPTKAAGVIRSLITGIEQELGIKISKIITGIPGHKMSNESVSLRRERENPDDSIEAAELNSMTREAYSDRGNERVYSAIPQSFIVGDAVEIMYDDAIGMYGDFIEGKYHLLTGSKAIFDGNERTFKALGLEIAGKYLYSIASSVSTLKSQEKQNGVAMVEFGGNTTNLLIYYKNIIRYAYTLPFGGNNITNDIANECKITEALAESIKRDFGSAMPEKLSVNAEKSLQIKSKSQRDIEVPIKYLAEIINARCKEIFDAILYKIEESGYADLLASGIVLTGGSANLLCIADYIKNVSGYNVRRAMPTGKFNSRGFPRLSDYSAASTVGLLTLALEHGTGMEEIEIIEKTDNRESNEDMPDTAGQQGTVNVTDEPADIPEDKPQEKNDDTDGNGGSWIKTIFGNRKKKEQEKQREHTEKKKTGDGLLNTLFGDEDEI